MRRIAATGLLCVLTLASSANAATLWRGAAQGMSPREVHKLFPFSHEDVEAAQSPDERIIVDRTLTVASHKAEVTFHFQNDRLDGVVLTSKNLTRETAEQLIAAEQAVFHPSNCDPPQTSSVAQIQLSSTQCKRGGLVLLEMSILAPVKRTTVMLSFVEGHYRPQPQSPRSPGDGDQEHVEVSIIRP